MLEPNSDVSENSLTSLNIYIPMEVYLNQAKAHSIVQNLIGTIWWGRISRDEKYAKESRRGFFWSLLCPLLAPTSLTFDGQYSNWEKIVCFLSAPRIGDTSTT